MSSFISHHNSLLSSHHSSFDNKSYHKRFSLFSQPANIFLRSQLLLFFFIFFFFDFEVKINRFSFSRHKQQHKKKAENMEWRKIMENNNPCEWVRYKKSISQCSFLHPTYALLSSSSSYNASCKGGKWEGNSFFLCFSRGLHGWLLLFSFYLISIPLLLLLLLPSCIHRRNEIHSHIVTLPRSLYTYRHTPFSSCSFFLSSSSSSTLVVVIWKNYRA